MTITQTVVFEFENMEQRAAVLAPLQGMMLADTGPRIVGLSVDDELKRSQLMFEALERYDDHYELRDAIEALAETPDLANWTWEKYENDSALLISK